MARATRAQVATIHIAKKQAAMDDDTYRDFLHRVVKKRSAADLDEREAFRVIAAFEKEGFEKPSKRGHTSKDKRAIVRKARAIWLSLYNLDEVPDGTDRALDKFASHITGKATLRFATNGEVNKVVEALKSWIGRFDVDSDTSKSALSPVRSLIHVQYRRVADAGADIGGLGHLAQADLRVAFEQSALFELALAMGKELRRLRLGQRHKSPSQSQGAKNG